MRRITHPSLEGLTLKLSQPFPGHTPGMPSRRVPPHRCGCCGRTANTSPFLPKKESKKERSSPRTRSDFPGNLQGDSHLFWLHSGPRDSSRVACGVRMRRDRHPLLGPARRASVHSVTCTRAGVPWLGGDRHPFLSLLDPKDTLPGSVHAAFHRHGQVDAILYTLLFQ